VSALAGNTRPVTAVPGVVRWLATIGAAATVVYVVLSLAGPSFGVSDAVLQPTLMAIAVTIGALRARRSDERRVWLTLTLGLAVWSAGQSYYLIVQPPPSEFTAADVGYLASYPLFWAAFIGLVRARVPRLDGEMWIDGLTCSLTIAAVALSVVHYSVGQEAAESTALLRDSLFGLTDASLVAIAVAAAGACGGLRDRTFLVLAAGFGLLSITDLAWLIQVGRGEYALGGVTDTGWTAALLIMAIAGWQPARPVAPVQGAQRLVLPIAFAGAGIGLLAIDHWTHNAVMAHPAAVALSCLALVCVLVRLVLTFREKQRALSDIHEQAMTDALTGLRNRRGLIADLDREAAAGREVRLVLFDLNGFKSYNDSFGHPAGDALLQRLGRRLAGALDGIATPYRLGGDEFCLIADARHGERPVDLALEALSDSGSGLRVTAAWGAATLGRETEDPVQAMRLADQRMYDGKRSTRMPVQHQVREVLLAALQARRPERDANAFEVVALARGVAERLDCSHDDVEDVAHAAELRDLWTFAVADATLDSREPLDAAQRDALRGQTAIAEQILRAAPAMRPVAEIVHAAHERYDGTGHPDGLSGEQIPLGGRILAAAEAYGAMTRERPHAGRRSPQQAAAELRRCAGSQFDPVVIAAFDSALRDRGILPAREPDAPTGRDAAATTP
jgi:two-component system cell cycle response regulator